MHSILIKMINLVIVIVALASIYHASANPIEIKSVRAIELNSPQAVEKTLEKSPETNLKVTDKGNSVVSIDDSEDADDDEDLDTADNIVFRPLFVYRQQQAKRKRVVSKPSRRKSEAKPHVNYYPYGYPSYGYPYYRPIRRKPVHKKEKDEFPALF